MIDGSVLQSAQRCFEKKSRVVVKMVVSLVAVEKMAEKSLCVDVSDLQVQTFLHA